MDPPITGWRRFAAMEPLAFALLFAVSISDNVYTDLILFQTCRFTAGLNVSDCNVLHDNSSSDEAQRIEKLVQPHTGLIMVLKSCIEVIFPTILSLFLGPWSDKHGRKPLLVVPFIGFFISSIVMTVLSTLNVNPYWYLLPSIPSALLGGFPPILSTFFCYITDITDQKNRGWHLACLDAMIFSGLLAGIFIGPVIYHHLGYAAVFAASGVIFFLCLLHSIFFLKETIIHQGKRTFGSLFDCALVKDLFHSVTAKREGYDRCLVWSCISAISLHVVIMQGNAAIMFLFSKLKLSWDITDYSIYSGTNILISMVGMLLIVKFVGSFLKLPETVVIVISCLSISGGYLLKAFVTKPWHMYLSSGLGLFSSSAVPMYRTILSKATPQKDLGKTFLMTTTMEMIAPFASSSMYMYVYTHTLEVYPYPAFILSAVLPFGILILAIVVEKRFRRFREMQYTPFVEVNE